MESTTIYVRVDDKERLDRLAHELFGRDPADVPYRFTINTLADHYED
jgi:hypothetical protein